MSPPLLVSLLCPFAKASDSLCTVLVFSPAPVAAGEGLLPCLPYSPPCCLHLCEESLHETHSSSARALLSRSLLANSLIL